jgi:hypothetical protein
MSHIGDGTVVEAGSTSSIGVPTTSSSPRPCCQWISYGVLGWWRGRVQFLEVAVILLGLMPGRMCC